MLQKTHRYERYPLSLEDVRIIDEIERCVKPIRFELCKRLNIKVGLSRMRDAIESSAAPFRSLYQVVSLYRVCLLQENRSEFLCRFEQDEQR